MSLKKVAARSASLDKCKLDAIKGQQIGKLSNMMPTPRPMEPQKRITPVDAPISPTMGNFKSQPESNVHEKKKKLQCCICEMLFDEQQKLNNHEEDVHFTKKFNKCQTCDKVLPSKKNGKSMLNVDEIVPSVFPSNMPGINMKRTVK